MDVGFDLVIGMHPHILQGYEVYHDKYIFYSLGNFVFDMPWKPTKYGAVVNVDLSMNEIAPYVEYVKIDDNYIPHYINEDDVPRDCQFDYLNKQLIIEDNSEEYHIEIVKCYKQYRKVNRIDILKKMLLNPSIIGSTLLDFYKRRLLK